MRRRLPAIAGWVREWGARARAWGASPLGWSVGCGLIVGLPGIGMVVRLWQLGWSPQADNAVLAWRSWLVTDGSPTFIGPYSLGSNGSAWTYNPGPLYFWIQALPTRLDPETGPLVGAGLVGLAALVVGLVAVGQVGGGRWLQVIVTVGGLVGSRGAAQVLIDPAWNIYTVMLPFVGLALLTWAIATGRVGWWPVAVFLGSFCAQTHLTFTLPSILLVLIGPPLGILAIRQSDAVLRLRWLVVGGVVGALCWVLPLWDQATGKPGHLRTLWRTAKDGQGDRVGTVRAFRIYTWSVVGNPPPWLHRPGLNPLIVGEGELRAVPLVGGLVVVALAAALVVGLRRRDHSVVGIAAVALAAGAGCIVAIQGASAETWFWTSGYLVTILYPLGMVTALALGWSVWRLVIQPRLADRELPTLPFSPWRPVFAGATVGALVLTFWMADWAERIWFEPSEGWPTFQSITDQTVELVEASDEPHGRLAIDSGALPGSLAHIVPRGLGYSLLHHGWTPSVLPHHLKMLGDAEFAIRYTDPVLLYREAGDKAPSKSTLLGTVHEPHSDEDFDVYIVEPMVDD